MNILAGNVKLIDPGLLSRSGCSERRGIQLYDKLRVIGAVQVAAIQHAMYPFAFFKTDAEKVVDRVSNVRALVTAEDGGGGS